MISSVFSFGVSVFYIWLKAFQQLNVQHDKYLWVPPISLLMALCEVSIVSLIVSNSFWLFIPIGVGGGVGCIAAMLAHKNFRQKMGA